MFNSSIILYCIFVCDLFRALNLYNKTSRQKGCYLTFNKNDLEIRTFNEMRVYVYVYIYIINYFIRSPCEHEISSERNINSFAFRSCLYRRRRRRRRLPPKLRYATHIRRGSFLYARYVYHSCRDYIYFTRESTYVYEIEKQRIYVYIRVSE